jgi:predicted nuclease of predicted toxin-antitoxin system
VKLILDQNLSYRLVAMLQPIFADVQHVRPLGMAEAKDTDIWNYAKLTRSVVVSKDSDFFPYALLSPPPPKFIWVNIGNASTEDIYDLIRERHLEIVDFINNPEETVFPLL